MFLGVSPQRQRATIVALFAVLIGSLLSGVLLVMPSVSAAPGINQTINFQGRLFTAAGATVPDGYYNVQFKIYQDGTGTSAGNPGGTLRWTEDHLNASSQGVTVKNGFMSVELGSVTPFGTSIDWNQDTLWLSMNIGNTNTSCTPFSSCAGDGEMVPMKRLSAVPYALNAMQLGGKTAGDFIQNGTAPQVGANFNISGTGTAGSLQASTVDAASGSLTIGASNATNIVIGKSTGTTPLILSSSSVTLGIAGAPTTLQASAQTAANTQGNPFTVQGATGNGTGNGGTLTLQGGNSGASGAIGGNVLISGGSGTTANGLVTLATAAYQTASNDTGCFAGGTESVSITNCTISQSSINNNASVIVGFTHDGQTAFMPDPTIITAGRVVYVTASNLSKDFTLSVNGGGQGNQIAMRKNTTATMIWNGNDWTAAGASSSTTLQAAYDNTLQSAGGAELVVSKTSATNGLTIRDSSVNPVNGTLLSVQTQSAAGLLSVNSNLAEYASNAGAETIGSGGTTTFPNNTWSAINGATVSRYTTAGNYIATGQGSVSVGTSTTASSGVKNQLTSALTAKMNYNVSFSARLTTGSATFSDLEVYYSADGSAATLLCANAKAVNTSVWTKINCTFSAPISGITASNAILIRQTGSGTARTFYVDNLSVTIAADLNYSADPGVNDAANFATNWSGVGGSTVTRSTTSGNDASDSAQVVTTGANQGVRNKLAVNPLISTTYRITSYVNITSGSFTSYTIRYSPDGGSSFTPCVDYNTQTIGVSSTNYTKVTCYVTTSSTAPTNPYLYFTQTDATGRTFYVDTVSMTLSTVTTPNVQIGGGVNGGPTTLFTLDRGASAPIASDNDALLGSMYYDTTLGKLQCYEADGWGACGSSPDNIITISPEYTNAVLHGTGIGTMTSDLCSDYLNINDGSSGQPTICGTDETYNFYKWTSPQSTAQTYSIYVTYQLPGTFKGFNSGQTSLMGRTDNGSVSGAYSSVQYTILRNSPATGTTPCGGATSVSTGTQTTWQIASASGAADPSTCGFVGGDSIVFKIDLAVSRNANAYVGNLNFAFSNR